jgi:GNAT superfamily N-acetyltransferase
VTSNDAAISLLSSADVAHVAGLLGRALCADPAYAHVFPDPADRAARLADLFDGNLRVHLPHRCTHVLRDSGKVVATVTVRPPAGVPISMGTMLRRGLFPFVGRNGLRATRRLLHLKDAYDALEAELAGHGRHWHVHMMAVEPALQGCGHGSRLLSEVLARNDRAGVRGAGPGLPTILTTHTSANVTFYRRLGFEVTLERHLRLTQREEAYPVWGMTLRSGSDARGDIRAT